MTSAALTNSRHSQSALDIPKLMHDEAAQLAATEAQRVLALIESLGADDWERPTDCIEWTVRDIVAHLAGAVAAQASWAEFKRQNVGNPYMNEVNAKIDAINRLQVEDRARVTAEELVAEFRKKAPKAVRIRRRLPWLLRQLHVPFGPPLGFAAIGYLTDTIFTRDQWMHRLDIARATGREMIVTPEHDGRIVALVMRDIGRKLDGALGEQTIDLLLTGRAGGRFRFGSGTDVDASIEMDVFTFNRVASGRLSAKAILSQASIAGEDVIASWFLLHCDVPY